MPYWVDLRHLKFKVNEGRGCSGRRGRVGKLDVCDTCQGRYT